MAFVLLTKTNAPEQKHKHEIQSTPTSSSTMRSPMSLSIWVTVTYVIGFPLVLALPWPVAAVQGFGADIGSIFGVLLWFNFLCCIPQHAVQLMRPAVAPDLYLVPFGYSRYCTYYKPKSGHSKPKREGYVAYSSLLFCLFANNSFCVTLCWLLFRLLEIGVDIGLCIVSTVINFLVTNVVMMPLIFLWICYNTFKDWLFLVSKHLFDTGGI